MPVTLKKGLLSLTKEGQTEVISMLEHPIGIYDDGEGNISFLETDMPALSDINSINEDLAKLKEEVYGISSLVGSGVIDDE